MISPLSPETGPWLQGLSSLLLSHTAALPASSPLLAHGPCLLACRSRIKDSTCPLHCARTCRRVGGGLSCERDGCQALHHPTLPAAWWVSRRDGMLLLTLARQGTLCSQTDCFVLGTAKAPAATNVLSHGFPCQACAFPTYLVTILEMHPSALSYFRWYLLCSDTCAGHAWVQ